MTAGNQQSKPIDIEKIVLNMSKEEILALRQNIDTKISDDEVKESLKKKAKIVIKNFDDERVSPFGRKTIYEVYCRASKTVTLLNGMAVLGFFGQKNDQKKSFNDKEYGAIYEIDGMRITFKQAEI